MANPMLTSGAIMALRKSQNLAVKPLVQVLNTTMLQVSGSERYKLEISDGAYSTTAMLATQHNELLKSQKLKINSIIRVKEYITNEVQMKQIVILLDVEVVETVGQRIGNPVEYSDGQTNNNQQTSSNPNRVFAPATINPVAAPPSKPQQYNAPPQQQSYQQQLPQQSYQQQPPQQSYHQQPMMNKNPPQQQYQQAPQQQYQSYNAPVASLQATSAGNRGQPRIFAIQMLNPYQNKWTIQARVTSKTDVKTWDKGPTNQGKLFSADLVDKDGTEIRATFFREAVDNFYPLLEVGGVYLFSEGKVKVANRQYSQIKNEYEIAFGKESIIQRVHDDANIVRISLKPIPLAALQNEAPKAVVDVVGVVIESGDVQSFTSKAGKDLRKMEIELVDQSNASIKFAIWGTKADEVAAQLKNAGPNPIVACKNTQVGDYGGRSLSSVSSSTILVNPPDIPQAGMLRTWFDQGNGRSGVAQMTTGRGGEGGEKRGPVGIEDRITFEQIKSLSLGKQGQADYGDIKGFLMFVRKDNLYYPACQTERCGKKLSQSPTDERWFCEKCNQSFPNPTYRYVANFNVVDSTGSSWCTAFNESGNALFGMTADDLERLRTQDETQFNKAIEKAQFQEGIFRLKVKEEMYNDQPKVKTSVMSFKPLDYVHESKELLRGISLYQKKM